VTFQCIDSLGEVNRAKVKPLAAPAYGGERADQRIGRILDLASWDPNRRDLWGTSDTLVADELGGQVADLLGQAADSAGGVIFADTSGTIGFRPRDFQTFPPGAPDDGVIGNIGMGTPGYVIPGVPQVDGYMSADAVRFVSTADGRDLIVDGNVRFTCRIRDDSAEAAVSRYVAIQGTGVDLAWTFVATYGPTIYPALGWPTGSSTSQVNLGNALRTAFGPLTPPGADVYLGAVFTGVKPGVSSNGLLVQRSTSLDGRTWTNHGTPAAAQRSDALSRDAAQPLQIGRGWQGRVYWAQIESINRARLTFPGSGGNFLSIPSAADQQITADWEVVARVQAPPAGFPNATVVAKNGSWYLWLSPTNISTGFTLTPSGSTFPGSSPHGFVAGTTYWIKVTRVAATGVVAFYTAPDGPLEPTVWSKIGADVAGTAGTIAFPAQPITVGVYSTFASPLRGRVLRVICRQGIGGATYFDLSENNAALMAAGAGTFVANSGQTVTVTASNKFVFPGVAGNFMSMPNAAPLNITGDIEIVARVAADNWATGVGQAIVSKHGQYTLYVNTATTLAAIFFFSDAPSTSVFVLSAAHGFVNGKTYWVKMTRSVATGLVSFYKADDNGTTLEPTTWTAIGTATPAGTAGKTLAVTTAVLFLAQRFTDNIMFAGRISRVLVRNGIAGTVVVDIAEHQSTFYPSTTVAAVGGSVTATQTAGTTIIQLDSSMPIVQPQPDAVVWRFDANDYPGTGTSYVDPRGRTWTLSAAGAIMPKVPAVPPIEVPPVPADICPVSWTRPFDRSAIATRVIVGRTADTAQVFDDLPAQELYGIEPFERTDLLTEIDSRITEIGQRYLATRGAATAPRVRSVLLDAATSPAALDLMTSVDVFKPSRYRCRLALPRGIVFDEEMFATAVMHDVDEYRWTLNLNLDAASPYEIANVRWDHGWWDQSAWSDNTIGVTA
jgi:hypothetical protein